VAHAIDCEFVYTLIPRKPLNELIEERAQIVASKRLQQIQHSMALEAQSVNDSDEKDQLENLIQQLITKSGSELWDDKHD
jgi:predicted DNA-binding mobile mystery protein A